MIPYGKQNIDDKDIERVVEVLKSPFITQGPPIEDFEEAIAGYCCSRHGVAFCNGTAALHAALYAAGIKPGDEVITSSITFLASANAALYMGAKPVLADIDPHTYCLDIEQVKQAITPKTRAIIPVDYAGYPVDIEAFMAIAERYNLVVIEDAAHALGAVREGGKVGSSAHMTMFSFHPVKHITTGEGGMIVTRDKDLALRLQRFRNHGIVREAQYMRENHGPWYYEMQDIGYNYRLTGIQAALGWSQFNKLEHFVTERNRLAAVYDQELSGLDWVQLPPLAGEGSRHAYHLYPLLVSGPELRRPLFEYLRARDIGVQVHYIPVHLQPYYRDLLGYKAGQFPAAEDFYWREISLPLFPGLSVADQAYVIAALKSFKE